MWLYNFKKNILELLFINFFMSMLFLENFENHCETIETRNRSGRITFD